MTIKIDSKLNVIESSLIQDLSNQESEKISGGRRLSFFRKFRSSRRRPRISRKYRPRLRSRRKFDNIPGFLAIGSPFK